MFYIVMILQQAKWTSFEFSVSVMFLKKDMFEVSSTSWFISCSPRSQEEICRIWIAVSNYDIILWFIFRVNWNFGNMLGDLFLGSGGLRWGGGGGGLDEFEEFFRFRLVFFIYQTFCIVQSRGLSSHSRRRFLLSMSSRGRSCSDFECFFRRFCSFC